MAADDTAYPKRPRHADVRRRRVVRALVAAMACATQPAFAQAAATRPRRVGILAPSTAAKEAVTLRPFFDEMRELGWTEGSTVLYERAFADDDHARLPALAAGLVARAPDLIYAPPQNAAVVARRATASIPIVFATGTDPVGFGLVRTLAHPGGNVTGVATLASTLLPKALEILREAMPRARRLGVLGDPADPRWKADQDALSALAPSHGITVVSAAAKGERDVETAIASLVARRVDVIFTNSSITYNTRDVVIALARRASIPIVGHRSEFVDAGALFSYGAPLPTQIRRSAHFVDRVLRGASPADMPVEQSTQIELVVNLRTARDLKVVIPASVLARADRVVG
jgi:putative ABC transport system substrate-binding protein